MYESLKHQNVLCMQCMLACVVSTNTHYGAQHLLILCRVVKLTSPNLNYVYIVGIIMLLIGIILYPAHSTDTDLLPILCIVSV